MKLSWVNEEVHDVYINMNLLTVKFKPLNYKSFTKSGKRWVQSCKSSPGN